MMNHSCIVIKTLKCVSVSEFFTLHLGTARMYFYGALCDGHGQSKRVDVQL